MNSFTEFEMKMIMQSKPLQRAVSQGFEYPWQQAARYNRETQQLKREACSGNTNNAKIAKKQLLRVRSSGDDSIFMGC